MADEAIPKLVLPEGASSMSSGIEKQKPMNEV
jgi:hypothetical protein